MCYPEISHGTNQHGHFQFSDNAKMPLAMGSSDGVIAKDKKRFDGNCIKASELPV